MAKKQTASFLENLPDFFGTQFWMNVI